MSHSAKLAAISVPVTLPSAICALVTALLAICALLTEPALRLAPSSGPLYKAAEIEPLTATPLPLLVNRSAPVTLASLPALFARNA